MNLRVLRQGQSRVEPKRELAEEVSEKAPNRRWLCCRVCGAAIADASARLDWGERPLIFANPEGMVYELIAVRDASSVHVLGAPTTEASWFAGYAWQVVICGKCLNHLGWNYSAGLAGVTPPSFYGLIRRELVEREEGETF